MDPPYELKEDYQRVLQTLKKAMQKWSTGIYALWYPILGKDADRSRSMLELFKYAGFPSVLVAELEVAAQPDEWGMNGSGMLILNAPWQLDTQLADLLPRLCQRLAQSEEAQWHLEWLVKPE